jgi:hypothetical protein
MAWIEGSRWASRPFSRSAALRASVRSGPFLARPVEEMSGPKGFARYMEDHRKGKVKAWQIRALTQYEAGST